jgi:hypothetical protein
MEKNAQQNRSIIHTIFIYLFMAVGIVFLLIATYRVSELILSYAGVNNYYDSCAYLDEIERPRVVDVDNSPIIDPGISKSEVLPEEVDLREQKCLQRQEESEKNNRAREIRDLIFFALAGGILIKIFRKRMN